MTDLLFNKILHEKKKANLYRTCYISEAIGNPYITIQGTEYLNFCSNDYLGLAHHPKIVEALKEAATKYGVGSGGSHLMTGHHDLHEELEHALAIFTKRPRALLFSSGYMANIGIITSCIQSHDAIFEDRLNHASLLDAGLLSRASFHRYRHRDIDHLEQKLMQSKKNHKMIVTDGVFSMEGTIAPLQAIAKIAKKHKALLMVDDAHGFGILGKQGEGTLAHQKLSSNDVPILMATFGKALGTMGAFAAGSQSFIDMLIQKARPYIFTTAIPPAIAAATLASLQIVKEESWRRDHLASLISQFKNGIKHLNLTCLPSNTQIQSIILGDAKTALMYHEKLKTKNILCCAIRPPTVPPNSSRLRISFTALHTEEHIDRLLNALKVCQNDLGISST